MISASDLNRCVHVNAHADPPSQYTHTRARARESTAYHTYLWITIKYYARMRLVLGIQRARAGITVRETRETFLINFSS